MKAAYLGSRTTYPKLINDLLSTTPETISVDVETISKEDRTLVGIGVGLSPTEAMYFPVLPNSSPWLGDVLAWLHNKKIAKVWHNCLFDLEVLSLLYPDVADQPTWDTMVMAQLAGYDSKLTVLAAQCGAEAQDMAEVLYKHKAKTTLELPEDVLAKKCLLDVRATMAAYYRLRDRLDMRYVAKEMELIPIILTMQRRGLKVDQEKRKELEDDLAKKSRYYKSICKAEGFNPASYKQVGYMLAKAGFTQVIYRGKYRTGKEILEKIDHPLAKNTLGYREHSKALSTYIAPLAGLDRAYTHISFETATRRLASANINMQNIPEELRVVFIGPFTSFDYSQQELRTLAHISGDRVMLAVFDRGEDIHQATANFMGIDRKPAKNVGFAMLYGGSPQTIAETAGITDMNKARELRRLWMQSYRQAAQWIDDVQDFGVKHLKVPTVGGAWLYIQMDQGGWEGVKRKAVNYCLPECYQALTWCGWKSYSEISVGDHVLGYDNGQLVWTSVHRVFHYPSLPMYHYYHRRFSVTCSSGHKWLTNWPYSGLRLTELDHLVGRHSSHNHIVLSAKAIGGSGPLTPDEAELLGWLVTDGHVAWQKVNTVSAHVFQSIEHNPDNCVRIYNLLQRNEWLRGVTDRGKIRWYYVPAHVVKLIWNKANLGKKPITGLTLAILHMSADARRAFLCAVRLADGAKGTMFVSQMRGETRDAIALAAFLEGYYPRNSSDHVLGLGKPYVSAKGLKREYVGEMPGWCIETDLHTWVARHGDNIMITGNSIQGSAAELTKEAMRRCKHLPMVLQVHDELLFDGDVTDELGRLELDRVGPFETPIDVRVMERWG